MDVLIDLAVCFWNFMVFGIFKFFSSLNLTHWRQNTASYAGLDGIVGSSYDGWNLRPQHTVLSPVKMSLPELNGKQGGLS